MPFALPRERKLMIGLVLMVATFGFMIWAIRVGLRGFADFDLFYFAGQVEQHGTYTNARAVAQAGALAHRAVPTAGAYGSPTLVGLVFQPLSFMPLHIAHLLWDLVGFPAVLIAMRKAGGKYWMWWTALLFTSYAFVITARWANFHLLTFALVVYAYGAIKNHDQKRAGVALGLAIAFKLFPAFLVVPLLITKRWAAAAWAVATSIVLSIAAIPALGWSDTFTAWHNQLSVGGRVSGLTLNAGLPALVLKETGSQSAARVSSIAVLLVGIGLIYGARKLGAAHCFALGVAIMLLGQTISWGYYACLLIIPLIALTAGRDPIVIGTAGAGYALACWPLWSFISRTSLSSSPPRFAVLGGAVLVFVAFVIPEDDEEPELVT